MQDKDHNVNEDQYVLDDRKIASYYDNLVATGSVDSQQLGSKDDFVVLMKQPGALLKLRQNLLDTKVFNENQLYSDPNEYYHTFVKKKDQSSRQRIGTTEGSETKEEKGLDLLAGADDQPTYSKEEVDQFWDEQDVMQLDYQTQTSDEQADEFAVRADNARMERAPRNDVVVRKQKEEARLMNRASNDFVTDRDENFSYHLDNGEMGKYFKGELSKAEEKYNKSDSRTRSRGLRNALYRSHADQVAIDVNRKLEGAGYDLYDTLVNPELLENLRQEYLEKGMPGKVWNMAVAEYQSDKAIAIRENESKFIMNQYDDFVTEGYSESEAARMVGQKIQTDQEDAITDTFSQREQKRQSLIQKEQNLMNNPNATPEEIYKTRAEIAGLPKRMYDNDGKRLEPSESDRENDFEAEMSIAIDKVKDLAVLKDPKTFKENLHALRDDYWLERQNMKRQLDAVTNELGDLGRFTQERAMDIGGSKQDRQMQEARLDQMNKLDRKKAAIAAEYRANDIKWQAAARMLALNENPTKDNRGLAYYGSEFIAGMIDYVPGIRKPEKRIVTEADVVREREGVR